MTTDKPTHTELHEKQFIDQCIAPRGPQALERYRRTIAGREWGKLDPEEIRRYVDGLLLRYERRQNEV